MTKEIWRSLLLLTGKVSTRENFWNSAPGIEFIWKSSQTEIVSAQQKLFSIRSNRTLFTTPVGLVNIRGCHTRITLSAPDNGKHLRPKLKTDEAFYFCPRKNTLKLLKFTTLWILPVAVSLQKSRKFKYMYKTGTIKLRFLPGARTVLCLKY